MNKVIYLSLLLALSNSHIEANKLATASKAPNVKANKSHGLATKKLSTTPSPSPLMNCPSSCSGSTPCTPQCTTLTALVADLEAIANLYENSCPSSCPSSPPCTAFCTTLNGYIAQLNNSQTLTEATFSATLADVCSAYGPIYGMMADVCAGSNGAAPHPKYPPHK